MTEDEARRLLRCFHDEDHLVAESIVDTIAAEFPDFDWRALYVEEHVNDYCVTNRAVPHSDG